MTKIGKWQSQLHFFPCPLPLFPPRVAQISLYTQRATAGMRACGLFQGDILQHGQQQVLKSWGCDCSFLQLLCLSPESTKRPQWSCLTSPRVSPTLPPVGSGAIMVWYHHAGLCHVGKDMAHAIVALISHLNGSPHSILTLL